MQRQSLGSPVSSGVVVDDRPRRRSRGERPLLQESSSPQRSIHLIPLLTLLCFLILYLFSHEPSPSDLTAFHGQVTGKLTAATTQRALKAIDKPPRHRKLRSGGGSRTRT